MAHAARLARCTLAAALAAGLAPAWAADAFCFDAAAWQQLQAQSRQQPALLYVWSPRMVLSVQHAGEVRAEAARLGLEFVPLHDGRLSRQEVQQALAAVQPQSPDAYAALARTRALCAPALVQADAYRHFPTAWVLRGGSYHSVPLVSAMPAEWWRTGMQLRLQAPAAQWRTHSSGASHAARF